MGTGGGEMAKKKEVIGWAPPSPAGRRKTLALCLGKAGGGCGGGKSAAERSVSQSFVAQSGRRCVHHDGIS